ncbi:MAG: NAD(P)-dependent oxidoreductase, partial [Pseudomonadota bacterium]|nr:NAD(P)-dependent oxidoreductase [Pseudomonadota bacterium]
MADKPVLLISNDWISDVLADALSSLDVEIIRGTPNQPPGFTIYEQKDWPALFGNTDIAVVSPITLVNREMMQAAPKLKAIMSPVIGVESIDVEAATDLGIIVGHGATPENFLGMSEATVLFIAALAMQMPFKQRLLAENLPRPKQLTARSVRGRTVGLVGMGRIARGVVDRLQGWECEIIYFDPYVSQDQAPAGVKKVELDELMKTSDFVSLHVTVTDETRAMIGEKELRMMKPTAYLVNTARGAALDEDAVYKILKEGAIAGAALDAFVDEPLPADSPLREFVGADNVILTPHMIGHSHD